MSSREFVEALNKKAKYYYSTPKPKPRKDCMHENCKKYMEVHGTVFCSNYVAGWCIHPLDSYGKPSDRPLVTIESVNDLLVDFVVVPKQKLQDLIDDFKKRPSVLNFDHLEVLFAFLMMFEKKLELLGSKTEEEKEKIIDST